MKINNALSIQRRSPMASHRRSSLYIRGIVDFGWKKYLNPNLPIPPFGLVDNVNWNSCIQWLPGFFSTCVHVSTNLIFCLVENFTWGSKRTYDILENNKKRESNTTGQFFFFLKIDFNYKITSNHSKPSGFK